MSSTQQLQSKVTSKTVQYLLLGIGVYLFALFLGIIAKLLFGITFVSYHDVDVDIVTYIVSGSIKLILDIIYIFGSAILVIVLWVYNFFIVEILFRGLVGIIIPFFKNYPTIPESEILELVKAFRIIMDIFIDVSYDVLETASDIGEDIVEIVVGESTGEDRIE